MNPTLSSFASTAFALFITAFVVYIFFIKDNSPTRKVVFITKDLGIAGEVTGFNKARGFKIYVNSSDVPYNFDRFHNEQIAPNDGLGYYIEHGDSIAKSPGATTLILKRKGQTSEWQYSEPVSSPQ